LRELPVFVKAGAIIPMQPPMEHVGEKPVDPLILTIFSGERGTTRVYEDEGYSLGYKNTEFANTTINYTRQPDGSVRVEILPAEGRYAGMLTARSYELRLRGTWPPQSVQVQAGGNSEQAKWHYDGENVTTIVTIPASSTQQKIEISVVPQAWAAAQRDLLDGVPGQLIRLCMSLDTLNPQWPKAWPPEVLLDAAQTGDRVGMHPENARSEIEALRNKMPQVIAAIQSMQRLDATIIQRAIAPLQGTAQKPGTVAAAAASGR
jgi:alpha-glucosidase